MKNQIAPFVTYAINHPARRRVDDFCVDHVKKWGLVGANEDARKGYNEVMSGVRGIDALVKGNTMLALAEATAVQLRELGERVRFGQMANESATLLQADISSFVTQQLHMALDIYPMLLAPRLMSIQPLTQPAAYVFFMNRYTGESVPRALANLTTFNKEYAKSAGENTLIPTIHPRIDAALVECEYYKLRYELSHEVDVKMRTQYGLNAEAIMDPSLVMEMAWEVDRVCIDRLIAFAGITYYFDPTNAGTFDTMTVEAQRAYEQKFVRVTLTNAETDIEKACYRAPNWAIAGTNVIKWLRRLPTFTTREATDGGSIPGAQQITSGSVIAAGELGGLKVLHDPQLDSDLMLIGFTETANPFYAGFIMAPFGMASAATAAWQDPDYMVTKKSRALAFATKGINDNQFAKVYLRRQS